MRKLRFKIEQSSVPSASDAWLFTDGEDLTDMLMMAVMNDVGTEIMVTVSGVTMFISAWEDPENWSSDWAEKLGVDPEDAPDAVLALLADAVEES